MFFHEVLGHRLEGHRQRDEEEGQTFTKKIGQEVLPKFLSVADDPTIREMDGKELSGTYEYDNEGVPAQRVEVIQNGVLKNFLMSRMPIKNFDKSNGHGRNQPGLMPTGRQGNLIVSSSQSFPEAQMREKLIEEVKKEGKPYGLYFDDIQGGFTLTRRSLPQAFQVLPVIVYKVYADGRPDELVRGVDIVGTPLAALTRIVATGDKQHVFNGVCGAESGSVPVSAIAPAMLFSEMEVQKRAHERERPPILPAPGLENTAASKDAGQQGGGEAVKRIPGMMRPAIGGSSPDGALRWRSRFLRAAEKAPATLRMARRQPRTTLPKGDALFEALLTELDRSKAQLKMDQVQAPYYIEYRVNDVDEFNAEAAFGALRESQRSHLRVHTRGGAYRRLQAGQLLRPGHGHGFHPAARRRSHRTAAPDLAADGRGLQGRGERLRGETLGAEAVHARTLIPWTILRARPWSLPSGPTVKLKVDESDVEQHAAGRQQSLPPVSGSAIGKCLGALLFRQRVFREFGRHDCAQWPHHRHGDAERRDASGGWHAARTAILSGPKRARKNSPLTTRC